MSSTRRRNSTNARPRIAATISSMSCNAAMRCANSCRRSGIVGGSVRADPGEDGGGIVVGCLQPRVHMAAPVVERPRQRVGGLAAGGEQSCELALDRIAAVAVEATLV